MARTYLRCARCTRTLGPQKQWIRLTATVMASGRGGGSVDRVEVLEEIDLCPSCAEAVTSAVAVSIDTYGTGRARKEVSL